MLRHEPTWSCSLLAATLLLVSPPPPARADLGQWGPSGLPVPVLPDQPGLEFVSTALGDDHGGMLVLRVVSNWNQPTNGGLEAAHVRGDGSLEPPGVRVIGPEVRGLALRGTADDGAGGAFVATFQCGPIQPHTLCWENGRALLFHVASDGGPAPAWPDTGVVLPLFPQYANSSYSIAIARDGAGGVFVYWATFASGSTYFLVGQHYSASGTPLWTPTAGLPGKRLFTGTVQNYPPALTPDGHGGVLVAEMVNDTGVWHTRLVRVTGAGTTAGWGLNGVALDFGGTVPATLFSLGPGANEQALVLWMNQASNMQVQSVDPDGNPAWDPLPSLVSSPVRSGGTVPGLGGDVYVVWVDGNYAPSVHYVSDGAVMWPDAPGGRALGGSGGAHGAFATADGQGGAWVAWTETRGTTGSDVYVTRLDPNGFAPGWDASGQRVIASAGDDVLCGLARTDSRLLVAASKLVYIDEAHSATRSETTFVQQVVYGTEAAPPATLAPLRLAIASPNPLRSGALRVSFVLGAGASARLEVLDVAGRRMFRRDLDALGTGRHAVTLEEARALRPGLYRVVLRQGEQRVGASFVKLE